MLLVNRVNNKRGKQNYCNDFPKKPYGHLVKAVIKIFTPCTVIEFDMSDSF